MTQNPSPPIADTEFLAGYFRTDMFAFSGRPVPDARPEGPQSGRFD